MAPELASLRENDATEFAHAASKSKSFHHGRVFPPTTTGEAEELARRRQGPADFGYLIRDQESGRAAGYIEITNIVRSPLQSGYLGYYMLGRVKGSGSSLLARNPFWRRRAAHEKSWTDHECFPSTSSRVARWQLIGGERHLRQLLVGSPAERKRRFRFARYARSLMEWTSAGRASPGAPFHAAPGVVACADRHLMRLAGESAL